MLYVIDDKRNGMIQVFYTDGIYSLNLQGSIDDKQSMVALRHMLKPLLALCIIVGHFRLYHALVDDHYQVICLESDCYPGAYVSWDTDLESVGFFVSQKVLFILIIVYVCHT